MRRPFVLLGSTLTTALVLGACADNPAAPKASGTPGVNFHIIDNVCDFVTFGRLIANGIVISGNAGGHAPGGGILGEIEIHLASETIHAHTITEYGRPLATDPGPFAGLANARVVGATGGGGESISLRVVDNGEPGTGDLVYLVIDGNVILGPQTIDQGNIQLHLNCRGPGD